jgi:hypothetical protein
MTTGTNDVGFPAEALFRYFLGERLSNFITAPSATPRSTADRDARFVRIPFAQDLLAKLC